MTYQPVNTLLWLDLPVLDIDRAVTFYEAVLQCKANHISHSAGNASIQLTATGSGLTLIRTDHVETSQVTPYLNCNGRLEHALTQVRLNGGKILQNVQSMEPFGVRAVITDSEGNRLALHSA